MPGAVSVAREQKETRALPHGPSRLMRGQMSSCLCHKKLNLSRLGKARWDMSWEIWRRRRRRGRSKVGRNI